MTTQAEQLARLLGVDDSSVRLQAALTAGTHPEPSQVAVLVERCGVERDFYVREMLTWALTRHAGEATVQLLTAQLQSDTAQARSQALHTLSKIGDARAWPAITPELLQHSDPETARTAWRAAVALAPADARPDLASILTTQLGRGNRELRMSLSRAFAELGPAADAALAASIMRGSDDARIHALASQVLVRNPDEGFDSAVFEATAMLELLGDADS
jgi:HEAT repeat protein